MPLSPRLPKILLVTTAIFVAHFSPAYADAKDDRIAAMEKQMLIMMEEIKALKAERATEKQEQAALKQQIKAIETKTTQQITEQIANIAPAAGEGVILEDGVKVSMKGGAPKITKGDFSWQPFGRIHLDAGGIIDDAVDHPNSAEFRRARLGMKGKVSKNFGYKVEVDFANEGVSLKDTYLNYKGIDKTEIRIGNFKPGYSIDEQTSSNDIVFIERAAPVDSFATSQQLGAGFITHDKNWSVAGGVFNDDAGVQSSDDEMWSVAGRVTAAPIVEKGKTVHVGASASYREPDQANDTFDFDARAENRLQTADSVAAVITDGESAAIYGVEAAASLGPVHLQGEYIMANVENRANNDPTFNGGYAQISWFPTGEGRVYKSSKGSFKPAKVLRPFNPSQGDWGAVELAARHSHLDLNDGGITGGELSSTTFGANWYLNDYVRFLANFIIVDTDENAVTPNDDPKIAVIRSQVKF